MSSKGHIYIYRLMEPSGTSNWKFSHSLEVSDNWSKKSLIYFKIMSRPKGNCFLFPSIEIQSNKSSGGPIKLLLILLSSILPTLHTKIVVPRKSKIWSFKKLYFKYQWWLSAIFSVKSCTIAGQCGFLVDKSHLWYFFLCIYVWYK